ncbi:hypothetical protein [Myxococcus sp. RHSTA-1-4]|uniref:hypothetical protein n=1 Tax=Myxococcus sp. RHSTA-1-4 TaxID=2874601 RepID=UPI001CBFEB52|nr:hypothetical protein [Myxococcus sp. RHSTA-1-4]MBZ4420746.1 hypothetical protein [Myxococcus sp. RHSTA-1-4]
MRGWHVVLAVMWAGLAACGGSDGGGGVVEETVPVERADFNAKAAEALCERYARCGLIEDRERCQAQELSSGFVRQVGLGTRHDAALTDGRVRYDADVARQCVEHLRGGSCEDTPVSLPMRNRGIEYDTQCRFLLGQVEDGGTCQWSTECRDGAYCDALPWTCGGACRREPLPEFILATDACPPGTVLIGGRCLTPGGEGARCGAEDGIPVGVCDQGTWCDQASRTHGTCQPMSREGEACDDYEGARCGWSLFCRDGRCQKPRGEGESCTAPGLGRFGTQECRDELFCDGDSRQPGTCRPRRGAGAACRGPFECETGMDCPGAKSDGSAWGTCRPAPRQGESCADALCGPGLVCASATQTCVPTVRLGEPCEVEENCYLSGTCVDGVCRPIGAQSCK